MFEFFFKYPMPVFSKGKFVLLGAWPGWVLLLLVVACMAGLAVLIWSRLPQAARRCGLVAAVSAHHHRAGVAMGAGNDRSRVGVAAERNRGCAR
jgi:hypothetical protein